MRSLLPILKGVAVLTALAVGYLAIEIALLGRGVPPANVRTFEAFLEWRPEAGCFYVTETDPPQLIAIGRSESILGSGPAAYVFDDSGKLTQWELETGEGGHATKMLYGAKKQLDLASAKAWFGVRVR